MTADSSLGAIRAVFEPHLQRAHDEGLLTWVEAMSEHARDVYAHFGFKVAEEVVIGHGRIDGTGNWVSDGEAIIVYAMIKE